MAASITIRNAGPKDIPHLMNTISKAKMMGNSAPSFYFRWIVQEGIVLLAENEGETQGFLIAERNNKIAYAQLIYLFVHPPFRNKGIGSELMREFLKTCRKKSVKYVDLHAQSDSAGFYKQFGFKEEGKFVALYRKWR